MILVAKIISRALSYCGVTSAGEPAEPEQTQLALDTLQEILRDWSFRPERNIKQTVAVIPNKTPDQAYTTLGTDDDGLAGDYATNFARIDQVQIEIGPSVVVLPVYTLAEYEAQPSKTAQGMPTGCAWDQQWPVSRIYFWPEPAPGFVIRIKGMPMLPIPVTPQDQIDLPEQYSQPLVTTLALALAPFYLMQAGVDQQLVFLAKSSISNLEQSISRMRRSRMVSAYGVNKPSGGIWTSPLSPPWST